MILIPENKIAHDSYIRIVGLFLATNGISIFQTDAEWQGDAKAMLRAIALDAASVVEEVLQTWFQIETDMRRDVVVTMKAVMVAVETTLFNSLKFSQKRKPFPIVGGAFLLLFFHFFEPELAKNQIK